MANTLKLINLSPSNNIFRVPIKTISFLECLDDYAIGHQETATLAEGDNTESARESLKEYCSYHENWRNLTEEQKRRIQPFLLDYDREIIKIPECERRFKNKREDYTCGVPMNERLIPDLNATNGEFGMCCCQKSYDVPSFLDCPYNK